MNPEHPIEWFEAWYADAVRTEPRVPDAMQLATVDASGMPRIRTVLMKGLDERGLVFYTNYASPKSVQLTETPKASACFHWKDLARQVIVSGPVSRVSSEESDAYFFVVVAAARLVHGQARNLSPSTVAKPYWRKLRT